MTGPLVSPLRLSLASLSHGGPFPKAAGCRVLELGTGRGESLLPLAFYDPEGSYLGLDGDPENIEAARAAAAEIGLSNLRFEAVDWQEPPLSLGEFDYVLGSDLLARVPEVARSEVLRLCRSSLAETGIAYLDYPVLPGAAQRQLVRTLILPLVGSVAPSGERGASDKLPRAEKARSAAEAFRAMITTSQHPYPQLLAMELSRLVDSPPRVIERDYLDAPQTAFLHKDVVTLALAHGLRFVCDSAWNRAEGFVAPEIREELLGRGLAGTDLEQALDVLRCRAARGSVFCRADVAETAPPSPAILDELWIVSALAPKSEPARLDPGVEVSFEGPDGGRIASPDPLLKAVLLDLRASYPRPRRFADAVTAAVDKLREAGADGEPSDEQLAGVAADLWELHSRGLLELFPVLPRSGESGSHTLHALARHEIKSGSLLTTPLHAKVALGAFDATLASHMDPGADEDTLTGAMLVEASKGGVAIEVGGARLTDPDLIEPMVRGLVRRATAMFARFGLS